MSIERFHQVCDTCHKAGEEYSFNFTLPCISCGRDVCKKCAGSWDGETKAECLACERERKELEAAAADEAWQE